MKGKILLPSSYVASDGQHSPVIYRSSGRMSLCLSLDRARYSTSFEQRCMGGVNMGFAQSLEFHQFNESYLHGLRTQDVETEAHFVSYFSRILQNKLRRHLACPEHIKDVQQETLLRAWAAVRAEGGIRQPERFGAFVSSVCNNILRE